MKRIIISIFVILSIVSCKNSDFLNRTPIDFPTEKTFYSTKEGLEGGVIGIYEEMASYSQYGSVFLTLMEKRADNVKNENPGGGGGIEYEISSFSETPANTLIQYAWGSLYKTIYMANKIINSAPNIKMSDKQRQKLVGQALFARGLEYFNLVRLFGEVPLITVNQSVAEARNNKRNSVSMVYDQIISDLKMAIDDLPTKWKDSERGRATSLAARGLLAKVYLYRQQYADVISTLDPLVKEIYKNDIAGLVPSNETFPDNIKSSKDVLFAILYLKGGFGTGVKENNRYRNNDNSNRILLPQSLFENGDNRKDLVAPTGSGKRPGKFNMPATAKEVNGDFPIVRCADVLLMYAEAQNEVNSGVNQEALKAYNAVRANANISVKTMDDFPTKEEFRKAIYKERRLELALECDRWFDIIRTNQFKEIFPVVESYRVLYPIPQSEIDNVNDKQGWQNQGY